jgi:hypothetical protein
VGEVVSLDACRRRFGPVEKVRTGIIALGEAPLVPVIDGAVSIASLHEFIARARAFEKDMA